MTKYNLQSFNLYTTLNTKKLPLDSITNKYANYIISLLLQLFIYPYFGFGSYDHICFPKLGSTKSNKREKQRKEKRMRKMNISPPIYCYFLHLLLFNFCQLPQIVVPLSNMKTIAFVYIQHPTLQFPFFMFQLYLSMQTFLS